MVNPNSMKKTLLFLCLSLIALQVFSQKYFNYSNETLEINSAAYGKKVTVNLHLPETLSSAAENTQYPITIIFDSQHSRTYPHIVNSMDMLTSEAQIPESIIVGISFDQFNRYYVTSHRIKEGETLMGIEKTERFVFDELIPLLQKKYQGNDFIQIMGHSRTGFLVNYLITKKSKEINVAIALSGFYGNKPLTVDGFKNFISNDDNFPNRLKYYYTAGTTLEEETYLKDYQLINDFIRKGNKAKNLEAYFQQTSNANHMTNFWMSVPPILIDAYADYNKLLNGWFHDEKKKQQITNPLVELKQDIQKVSEKLGFSVNPGLTHLFSIASMYSNDDKNLPAAIEIMEYGLEFYPNYTDLNVTYIDFVKRSGNTKKFETLKNQFTKTVQMRSDLTEKEKAELIKSIE